MVAGAQMGVAQDSNALLHSGAIDAASPDQTLRACSVTHAAANSALFETSYAAQSAGSQHLPRIDACNSDT